jgi:chitodextrinase
VTGYRVRVKGPGTPEANVAADISSIVFPNLQVDATYEYSLTAKDVCGDSAASVRLVRLNDTSPPTVPIVAQPAYIAASKAVSLSWVPSSDNVQIDHYLILRNGVPLSATDATTFTDTDTARLQATSPSYVVRAVDTNGNISNSDAKTAKVPDWSPPTPPVLSAPKVNGTTVTLTWSGAADNIGVVGYDVLRNGKTVASMTGAVRKYIDRNVKPGPYTYAVQARDEQGNPTSSTGQNVVVRKPHVKATVVALKMAGALRGGAARYAINGPARLLLDVRIVGDLKKAKLRVYVQSGKGRITVWRGTPGSSAPRERLHSALARHGWVTIKLNRTLHPGRTRLVLIASNRMVIAGKGLHKPSMPDK